MVELDEEVARDPEREEVDGDAAHDLIGAQVDREERVHEREQAAEMIPITSPPTQLPVLSAPQMPQNAPISIMPSRPMFTTPERSENMPPIAAYVSGVAKTSIDAIRLAVKTSFRSAVLERVASTPRPTPRSPTTTAPQPARRAPRLAA